MRTLIQALKTKELRKKILFVLFIIIVYRIGSFIPTPGVDYNVVNKCMATIGSASQENFIGLVNLFSGGAMLQLSIFALGVMPYITASIVVQLLRVVIPRFEALHKEGQSGEAKLTQYTRYLTIGLAVLQSTTILVTARSGALFNYQCDQVIPDGSVFNLVVMVLIMTGGTGLIMWMAELVTDKGIGQGMSILIFMSICSGFLLNCGRSATAPTAPTATGSSSASSWACSWSSSSSSTSSNCASAASRCSTRAA